MQPYSACVTNALSVFLARHTPIHEAEAIWGGGTLPLRLRWYLGPTQPPFEYVTSVRCVVLRGHAVLVMHNRNGRHVWPGGRREAGETPAQTIARELLEEAGCTVGDATPIGFVHLHHHTPVPPGHPYPAPDFCWLLFAAEAQAFDTRRRLAGDYEEDAEFVPLADIPALGLEAPAEQALAAALDALRPSPTGA